MLKQPDRVNFIKHMIKEIYARECRDHYEVFLWSSATKGMKSIASMWVFKYNILPDGTLFKHKTRLCARDRQ